MAATSVSDPAFTHARRTSQPATQDVTNKLSHTEPVVQLYNAIKDPDCPRCLLLQDAAHSEGYLGEQALSDEQTSHHKS